MQKPLVSVIVPIYNAQNKHCALRGEHSAADV